ncbi:SDR family NAD(P)-dependent oxidoreductase [Streptomyces sp. NPDC002990]
MDRATGSHERGTSGRADDVAIIGIGCRLPGRLNSIDALWSALIQGRDLVTRIPPERFDTDAFTDADPRRPGRTYTDAAGVLADIAAFDTEYFGISPREAACMDPQQRLLLELAAEAIDDAGIDPAAVAGTDTGVFVGVSNHAYGNLQFSRLETVGQHTMTGIAGANTAGRLSHAFDLRGPNVAVDTACSSSLVALHQACEFLRAGGEAAVAAGVNILISPHEFIGFAKASMLSPTGRCRAFSAVADGFVRAEGGVVLLLKSLDRALADGDRVHAVITATGTNSDGRTPGLAQPSAQAQAALLRQVYGRAGLEADDLLYLEAHGTGTPVGDPLECEAVSTALAGRRSVHPLPIGSIKTNLGHLESASGLAGLLKAVLVLRHRVIPASLHGQPVSSAIDFAGLGLSPVPVAVPVPTASGGLVGVNSFGFGGANAHAVLAPAPAPAARTAPPPGPRPLLVSARTPAALAQAATALADRLCAADVDEQVFYDIAHTTVTRRGRHPHRAAVLAADAATAADRLRAAATNPPVPALAHRDVAFVYNGNGAQWTGMGRSLISGCVPFREAVEEIDGALAPLLGWSVHEELATGADTGRQARTEVAQPLLFTVQAALTATLATYGVQPAAVAGHSVGEVAAAYACGALDLPGAALVIAHRSSAQARTAGSGRMAAVGLSRPEAEEELAAYDGRLELAAVNSPQDVTVAGDEAALDDLARTLAGRGTFFRMLDLDHAFHSRHMDPIEEELRSALDGLAPQSALVPFASTVTGGLLKGHELTAEYWWLNVRRPVRLTDAVQALAEAGCGAFVEIGPHPVLSHYLRRTLTAVRPTGQTVAVPTLSRDRDGAKALETTAATLLAAGARTDHSRLLPVPGRVQSLPSYPWQREHHWHGAPQWFDRGCGDGRRHHPLLGERAAHPDPLWQTRIDPSRHHWLADHVVADAVVLPAAAFAETALAAGRLHHQAPVQLTDLAVERALVLPFDDPAMDIQLQTALDPADGTVRLSSREGSGAWRAHARGVVRRLLRERPAPQDLAALHGRLSEPLTAAAHYAAVAATGISYGPAFTVLTQLHTGPGEVLARYTLTTTEPSADPASGHILHPTVLDGAIQAGAALLHRTGDNPEHPLDAPYLPAAVDALRVWSQPPSEGWVHVRHREATDREVCWDIRLLDDEGQVTAELDACRLRRFDAARTVPRHLTTVLRAAPHGHDPDVPSHRLPGPRELAHALSRTSHTLSRTSLLAQDDDRYARTLGLARTLSAHFTLRAAHTIDPAATTFTPDTLIAAGALPEYRRALHGLLGHAERAGLLSRTGDGVWTPTSPADPQQALTELLRTAPGKVVETVLYSRCGTVLADVLLGRQDPVALLFGDAERHWMESFYSHTEVTRHYNATAAALAREIARHWPAGRPLRVLETGAGTGALTAALLAELPADRTHYTFTDVSEAFFHHARRRFSDHDHITYRTLDLDQDPERQGFTPGSYDLVIAGNVLHATSRLRESLTRTASLLDDGGHLLAVETHNPDVLLPIFGLLTSFWHADDPDLRPDSPLLAHDQWPRLLAGNGFDETAQLGADRTGGDYSVLLARRGPRPQPRPVAPAPATGVTSWIIATEHPHHPLASSLATALRAACDVPVDVVPATTDPAQWAAQLSSDRVRPAVVLLLADSGIPRDEDGTQHAAGHGDGDDESGVLGQAVTRTAVLRALAQSCAGLARSTTPELWLITRPSGALPTPGAPLTPGDAVPWGVARTIANEQTRPVVRRLSFEPGPSPERDARRLARELLAEPSEEDEIVLASGGRFVPRLREAPAATVPAHGSPYRLRLRRPGLSFGLDWTPAPAPPAPGPGQVAIEVRAAALNYRDVMLATGLLPPGAENPAPGEHSLGLECAGVVSAVGAGAAFTVGQRVLAYAPGALASNVVVPALAAGPIPDHLSFAEAATLPVAFFTVQHGLEHLGRLTEGETVLVHGAAGGVGLAALQYAHQVGARVIATAGSPAKRDLLTLLGADHVLDSRTLAFADQVMELTGGQGVDVVLNSLAGEAIARNLDILRPGGRCIELGKRDIHSGGRLPLRPFRNNLSLHAVDAHQMFTRQPQLASRHFAALVRRVHEGAYQPLPHQVFPADQAMEAFTLLRHSRHIGKVVLSLESPPYLAPTPGRLACDPDATYLITGGLTGLGAATARFLAARGARHLALVSRRGPATPGAAELIADLARHGATTTAYAADAADPIALGAVLEEIDGTGRPLRGVVHSAMTLEDRLLTDLSDEAIRTVLAPKLSGAAVLDRLTRKADLEFFVLNSSISATVGHRAQAAYAAANLAMEGLVRARRAAALPALAVGWGLIGEIGTAVEAHYTDTLERMGLGPLSSDQIFTALEDLMTRATDADADAAVVQVGHFDFPRMVTLLPTLRAPRFAALLPPEEAGDQEGADLRRSLACGDPQTRHATVADILVRLIARVTHHVPERVDRTCPLDAFGMDSLMATELVVALQRELACEIPVLEVINAASINDLASRVLTLLNPPATA